jgi:hypothetical protein
VRGRCAVCGGAAGDRRGSGDRKAWRGVAAPFAAVAAVSPLAHAGGRGAALCAPRAGAPEDISGAEARPPPPCEQQQPAPTAHSAARERMNTVVRFFLS